MGGVSMLPRRYSEQEAAEVLGISVSSLRCAGIRQFRPTPRKIYYLENDLLAFIEDRTREWPGSGAKAKSVITGYPGGPIRHSTAAHGSTPPPLADRCAAHRLAQQIF